MYLVKVYENIWPQLSMYVIEEMSSGLIKQILNCLLMQVIIMFWGNMRRQPEEHHPMHEAQFSLVFLRCFVASGTGALYKINWYSHTHTHTLIYIYIYIYIYILITQLDITITLLQKHETLWLFACCFCFLNICPNTYKSFMQCMYLPTLPHKLDVTLG